MQDGDILRLKDGKVTDLKVLPESREKDIVIMIEKEK